MKKKCEDWCIKFCDSSFEIAERSGDLGAFVIFGGICLALLAGLIAGRKR